MSRTAQARGTGDWDPPGPGTWTIAADHFPRPVTPSGEPFLQIWSEVTTEFMNGFGVPIGDVRMELVNGLPYMKFGDPAGSSKTPPTWVMWLALKLVPSMRKSEAAAARVLRERPWLAGTRQWYEVDRPKAIDRANVHAAIDLQELDDVALARHVVESHAWLLDSARHHIALHAYDFPPVAVFAGRMIEWGFTADESYALLGGSSPASKGDSDELAALRAAVSGRKANSIDELRSLGEDVSAALDQYLSRHGWRLIDGYDIDGRCLIEVPSLVLALATAPPPPDRSAELDAAVTAARERVPAADRSEFDQLIEEARYGYGLRDDNSAILWIRPAGLLRRALLEAGNRLAGRGDLPDPELVIEAAPADIADALTGVKPLDAEALAARAAFRRATLARDAPRRLGPPEPPIPTNFPGALGKILRAFAAVGTGEAAHIAPLRGLGIGTEPYEGTARLLTGTGAGFDQFEPGDVLIASMTSPSYNVVIAVAGAMVTEEGDGMSHAAIMARELGIPAVIGALGATTQIHDGDRVVVDPTTGTVRVLESSAASTNQGKKE